MTMKTSETLGELFKALSKAQGEIKPAVKDALNPHLKSKYADLGSVWEACRQALADNGLSVSQWPITPEGVQGITLMTVLGHTSGEYIMASYTMPTAKNDAQGYGSTLTYSKRYALASVLGIWADDDDDGHAASQRPATAQNRPSTPRQPAPRSDVQPGPTQATVEAPIGKENGKALHERLGAILQHTSKREMSHAAFAAEVLGKPVSSLAELTRPEASQVQSAARSIEKAEQSAA